MYELREEIALTDYNMIMSFTKSHSEDTWSHLDSPRATKNFWELFRGIRQELLLVARSVTSVFQKTFQKTFQIST